MIATLGSLKRGLRNVIRNPIRLVLVVVLLGASLTFTAAMLALNSGSQNQINKIQQQVGTSINVAPEIPFSGISAKQVAAAEAQADVVGITQTLEQQYPGTNLYGTAKIPKNRLQFGFSRSKQQTSGGGGFPGFPGGGTGSGSGGRFVFTRHAFNAGKGNTMEPSVTGITGAASGITVSGGAVKIAKGRDLSTSDSTSDVALMSESLAKANKLTIGSTFKLRGTKTKLIGEYTVVGAAANPYLGKSTAGNSMILPLKLAEKVVKLNGVTSLVVYANTASNVNTVVNELTSATQSSSNPVSISSSSQTYASTFDALNSTSHNVQAALIASIITAALVIVFAVFIIVRERTREIGVLKAIGASSTNIVAQFTSEVLGMSIGAAAVAAVLLAIFGGQIAKAFNISPAQAAGTPTFQHFGSGGFTPGGGLGGSFFATRAASLANPIHTTPLSAGLTGGSLLALLGIAIGLAVLASWIPTWYVSRLQPARVLSNA